MYTVMTNGTNNSAYAIVAIGTSQGGLHALMTLFSGLPADFALPVAVVQHRLGNNSRELAGFLQQYSALPVADAQDKQPITPGHVYLAPADYHLLVEEDYFALSTEAPVQSARPSIDVFFESVAAAFRQRVIGVVLTGASDDGAQGLACIKHHGGLTLVQSPETAENPVMPTAALAASTVDHTLPLDQIAPLLMQRSSAERYP